MTTSNADSRRLWVGAAIVGALVIAVVVAMATGDGDPVATPATAPAVTVATTAPEPTPPPTTVTSTTAPPPTTLSPEARFAEIEALVTDLEFRMWHAAYSQDQDELAELIGQARLYEAMLETGQDRDLYFNHEPTTEEFGLTLFDVLLDRPDCVVVAAVEKASPFFAEPGDEELVIILWPVRGARHGWRIVERWGGGTPESVWIADCDLQNRDWRP